MTEDLQTKKSAFQDGKEKFIKWLNKEEVLEKNITANYILKSFSVIIPIHSILYLTVFYKQFGITYFNYFNPLDLLTIFYANNVYLLLILISLAIVVIHLKATFKDLIAKKYKVNRYVFIALLISFLLGIYFTSSTDDFFNNLYLLSSISITVSILLIKHKKLDTIFNCIVFVYFVVTMGASKYEAYLIKKNKPNFDIILTDDSYLLKESNIDHNSYFIGKTTNYIFIRNDSLKKVKVIPLNRIKEIQLTHE